MNPENDPIYTLTTYSLGKEVVRQSRHRSLTSLGRYHEREQRRVHPEGRGADKPWSGYVEIHREADGARMLIDYDPYFGRYTLEAI